jgi:hypothetical protein
VWKYFGLIKAKDESATKSNIVMTKGIKAKQIRTNSISRKV